MALFLKNNLPKRTEKYYRETDGDNLSYETKFNYNNHFYSVEFDSIGNLQDIEIVITENEIPDKYLIKIKDYLKQENNIFKIEKIQAQFLAKDDAKLAIKTSFNFNDFLPDNYELIVVMKINNTIKKFEFLFNYKGVFIVKRKVIRNSYDYLLF